jgi:hypothetical protein
MPDQLRYLNSTQDLRQITYPRDGFINSVGLSSVIFSFIPLPFINSVQSLAMVNFLLYLFILVFLRNKGIFTKTSEYFYLIYPSYMLYSSVALREMLILIFMLISIYHYIIKEKIVFSFLFSLPLIIIKPQNFLMLSLAYSIHYLFYTQKFSKRIIFLVLLGIAAFILKSFIISRFTVPSGWSILQVINNYRHYMFYEDTGSYSGYIHVESWMSFFFLAGKGFFYMLLKPFPWQCENILHFIQSIENLIIFCLIIYLITRPIYFDEFRKYVTFLKIILIISMSIYGFAVFNFGSAARYRFGFLLIFILFYFYFLYWDRVCLNYQNKFTHLQIKY